MQFSNAKSFLTKKLYGLISAAVKAIPANEKPGNLLLIKTDEIGDYTLFRHFLHYFRESNRYAGWHITLVGNKAWKQLYDALDDDAADKVIWLDKTKFKKSLSYRFSFLKAIRSFGSAVTVNCIFSRNLLFDDTIAAVATGRKIAMVSDIANRKKGDKDQDNRIYTEIIEAGGPEIFDQVRNYNFLRQLLPDISINLSGAIPSLPKQHQISRSFFVLFIGAGHPERKWPLKYFARIAAHVSERYGLLPVIAGGPAEATDAATFKQYFSGNFKNLAGKTSLPEFLSVLREARFLLSVDTGAVHLAAMVHCPVVGLFSGKFHGRFAPYPKEIFDHFYPIYPGFIDPLITGNDPVLHDTEKMKNDTARLIPPEKIIRQIDLFLAE